MATSQWYITVSLRFGWPVQGLYFQVLYRDVGKWRREEEKTGESRDWISSRERGDKEVWRRILHDCHVSGDSHKGKKRGEKRWSLREACCRPYSSCYNLWQIQRKLGGPGYNPHKGGSGIGTNDWQEITAAYHHPHKSMERPRNRTEECLQNLYFYCAWFIFNFGFGT